jgi:hypothetical protein
MTLQPIKGDKHLIFDCRPVTQHHATATAFNSLDAFNCQTYESGTTVQIVITFVGSKTYNLTIITIKSHYMHQEQTWRDYQYPQYS